MFTVLTPLDTIADKEDGRAWIVTVPIILSAPFLVSCTVIGLVTKVQGGTLMVVKLSEMTEFLLITVVFKV